MPRLRDGLTVQFEDQFRMAGQLEVGVHILMTSHTGVGANIEASQIAHAGVDTVLMTPIRARVRAQPMLPRAVTALTGDAFGDSCVLTQLAGRHCLEWRMTNGAPLVLRRTSDSQDFGNAL